MLEFDQPKAPQQLLNGPWVEIALPVTESNFVKVIWRRGKFIFM